LGKLGKVIIDFIFYDPINETLKRNGSRYDKVLDMWKEGADKKILSAVSRKGAPECKSMDESLTGEKTNTMIAFDQQVYGINSIALGESSVQYLAAFDLEYYDDIHYQKLSIEDGIRLFTKLVGYSPSFFVPSNGPVKPGIRKLSISLWN